jgi:hypothetical protein
MVCNMRYHKYHDTRVMIEGTEFCKWDDALNSLGSLCKAGQKILVGWKRNHERITIYTLEHENGALRKYIRVHNIDDYPDRWDYVFYP